MDWLEAAGRTENLDASRTDGGIPNWRSQFRVKRFGNPGRDTGDLRFVIAWYDDTVAQRLLPHVLTWVVWHSAQDLPGGERREAGWGKVGVNWMVPKSEQAPNSAFASQEMRWALMAEEDGRPAANQRARGTAQDRVVAEKGRGRANDIPLRHMFVVDGVWDGNGPIRPAPGTSRSGPPGGQDRHGRPGTGGQGRWNTRRVEAPGGFVVTAGVDTRNRAGPISRADYAYRPPASGEGPAMVQASPLAPGWNSNRGYMRAGPEEARQAQPKAMPKAMPPKARAQARPYTLDHIHEDSPWADVMLGASSRGPGDALRGLGLDPVPLLWRGE